MKNAFYFTWKTMFVLKIFEFLSWFFGLVKKKLDKKDKAKNISRCKGNETMNFSMLIQYNMRNTFLENHTQNLVEKLFPEPFLKSQHWADLWINSLKFYTVCFYFMPSWGLSEYIETKLVFHTSYKDFLKNKKKSGTSIPVTFSAWFLKKYLSCYILSNDQISLPGLPLLCGIMGNICIL